jgi:hypothetical protein
MSHRRRLTWTNRPFDVDVADSDGRQFDQVGIELFAFSQTVTLQTQRL